jgi:hypothetical protein
MSSIHVPTFLNSREMASKCSHLILSRHLSSVCLHEFLAMDNVLRHEISSERIELIAPYNWKQHVTNSFDQQDIGGFDR